MTITPDVRDEVRRRANFACEFCGVTEADTAGEMTIDHFRPRREGGEDSAENLVYCCFRCNVYKADYWPHNQDDAQLWDPRRDPAHMHFVVLDEGTLHAVSLTGRFTIAQLRLNRPPLVAYRLKRSINAERRRLLSRYRDVIDLLRQVQNQQAVLLQEQRDLLEQQRQLLASLLRDEN